ncbi:50S ribosomal subunit protein L11 [Candidatus Hodgkinia cicadicola]|uniref:Large ribosomal subunit protein uL11 n=1 Tax=Candidatus Hodgkinia cicadicola TaxID=573658 RepID=A0ABX4MH07_9HYPH|nr:50S ribosomal subunit protein L11 [Candidatus Hodgkinia cicadicola]
MIVYKRDYIKLRLLAKKTKPNPSINVILGQKRINIADFCKKFNELTINNENLEALCVKVYLYQNKDYDIIVKNPSIACLIKKYVSSNEDLNMLNKEKIIVNKICVLKIIKKKINDINTFKIKYAFKMVIGSLKSMGMNIEN